MQREVRANPYAPSTTVVGFPCFMITSLGLGRSFPRADTSTNAQAHEK